MQKLSVLANSMDQLKPPQKTTPLRKSTAAAMMGRRFIAVSTRARRPIADASANVPAMVSFTFVLLAPPGAHPGTPYIRQANGFANFKTIDDIVAKNNTGRRGHAWNR
jgi:hypothetical protein